MEYEHVQIIILTFLFSSSKDQLIEIERNIQNIQLHIESLNSLLLSSLSLSLDTKEEEEKESDVECEKVFWKYFRFFSFSFSFLFFSLSLHFSFLIFQSFSQHFFVSF